MLPAVRTPTVRSTFSDRYESMEELSNKKSRANRAGISEHRRRNKCEIYFIINLFCKQFICGLGDLSILSSYFQLGLHSLCAVSVRFVFFTCLQFCIRKHSVVKQFQILTNRTDGTFHGIKITLFA